MSFYRAGNIVLAEVRYIRRDDEFSEWELYTTQGRLDEDSVLERRAASSPGEPRND